MGRNQTFTSRTATDQVTRTTLSMITLGSVFELPARIPQVCLQLLAQDYWVTFLNLQHSPTGDMLALNKIAGPTICCSWVRIVLPSDLAPLSLMPQKDLSTHMPYSLGLGPHIAVWLVTAI